MGRELRRKQAKREGKSLQREIPKEEHQIKNLVIITIVIIVIVAIMYFISAVFITKELVDDNSSSSGTTENLVSNTILASEIFKQAEEEYYVYFYDYDNEDTEISSIISSNLSDDKVYKVDTGSALNNNYVSEESNKSAKTLTDLKVKSSTVVKISGEQIVAYYENEEIINNLK